MLEVSFMASDKEKSLESIEGIILALFGFKPNHMTININRYGKEAIDFIGFFETDHDNSYGYVRLSTEGAEKPVSDAFSWNLNTSTRIYSAGRK